MPPPLSPEPHKPKDPKVVDGLNVYRIVSTITERKLLKLPIGVSPMRVKIVKKKVSIKHRPDTNKEVL